MPEINKLVRDGIPPLCWGNGEMPHTRVIEDDEEYLKALYDKLGEEGDEARDAPTPEKTLEELADAMEVINAIGRALGYSPEQIEATREAKALERGAFGGRIYLISTEPAE